MFGNKSGAIASTCCVDSGPVRTSRVVCLGSEANFTQCSVSYSPRPGISLSHVGVECRPGECLLDESIARCHLLPLPLWEE